jgi:hypothetical protein
MQIDIKGKDLPTLLALYCQEVDTLRSRLLEGDSWQNLKRHTRNVTELAIALHRSYNYIVPNKMTGNPAEFPQLDSLPVKPSE